MPKHYSILRRIKLYGLEGLIEFFCVLYKVSYVEANDSGHMKLIAEHYETKKNGDGYLYKGNCMIRLFCVLVINRMRRICVLILKSVIL